tara:strand:+ start:433 stop:1704 length:1272 start_codon:yes stop_codon:yes gene_type:complete
MSVPTLTPTSTTSAIVLPVTGTHSNVNSATNPLPFGIYSSNPFLSGAVDQVAYTYKKLGGDVLDLEITEYQVYSAYEEAVLEYSYIVNSHQAKNVLSDLLGATTASFDQDGQIESGHSLSGSNVELKYPKFNFAYAKTVADGISTETGMGGTVPIYSASFDMADGVQDYNLQTIISSSATGSDSSFFGKVGDKRVTIRKVFYKTAAAMWRFYGYYGGINVVGNLSTYGQYADDSTFQIVPTWQNKAQAMAYEDALYTRISHWSYELKNNQLRIFPIPRKNYSPTKFWVEFSVDSDPYTEVDPGVDTGIGGVNNMNTLPFQNIPYENINSIGKQWIRRFALSVAKEMLGLVRSKFATIPIPGNDIQLNGSDLVSQGQQEQEKLRDELKEVLNQLTYQQLAEDSAGVVENSNKIMQQIPAAVFVG